MLAWGDVQAPMKSRLVVVVWVTRMGRWEKVSRLERTGKRIGFDWNQGGEATESGAAVAKG